MPLMSPFLLLQQCPLAKPWTAIDRLWIIWKSDLSDKIKCIFFQAVVVWILLYRCTWWTLTKCIEKKIDENCMRILQVILNKSRKQHSSKQQLYKHLSSFSELYSFKYSYQILITFKQSPEIQLIHTIFHHDLQDFLC